MQEQPKPEAKSETKPEANGTTQSKPEDMDTEQSEAIPEATAEPVVEDPMEQ